MRVDIIRLQNYRPFDNHEFRLAARFNLVVGDNATGKTSILNGLAFALGSLFRGFPEPAEPAALTADVARTRTFWNDGKPNVEPQYPIEIGCEGEVNRERVAWFRELRKGGKTTWAYSGALEEIAERMASRVVSNKPAILPVLAYYGTGRVWKQKGARQKVGTTSPGSRFLGYLNCLDPASDEKRLLEWFKTRELVALQEGRRLTDLEAVREAVRVCINDADAVY